MELLERLGYASSKAEDDEPGSRAPGSAGTQMPTSAPAPPRPLPWTAVGTRSSSPAAREGSARRSRSDSRATAPTRVAIGYFRSDTAARRPATSSARSEPSRCWSAATSPPSASLAEVAALGGLDVLVHNAATGVIRPALETDDKHWDWTLTNARAFLSLARAAAPSMRRVVDRRDLEPGLDPGARELRARRHLESGPRGARAVPRGRARAPRYPRQRRVRRGRRDGRARALPEPRGDARDGRPQRRPAASSRPRTLPPRSYSSARPTPR